jgi:iron complex outermembrane receptor protein
MLSENVARREPYIIICQSLPRLHLALAVLLGMGAFVLHPAVGHSQEPAASEPDAAEEAGDAHHDDRGHGHHIEHIVVTGAPIEHDRDELAVPVDRIDRDELLDTVGATLGETLAVRPGISTSGFTGGASRPVIRGQDAFRTEVTEDGLPTQDVSRESPDHAVPVNPLAIERIEVVRGPATLRYGGGASAGVVNAITNRVPDQLPGQLITGEFFGALDSVADRRDASLTLDGEAGPVAWHVDGLYRKADDYRIPTGGRQRGTFADAWAASGGLSYFIEDAGRLGFGYSHFDSQYGIPEEDEDARIDMRSNRYRFEGDWLDPLSGVTEVRVRGAYTGYRHDEIAEGVVGQTYRNDQFDGRLELLHEPIFGFLGAVGLTGRNRDLVAEGEAAEFLAPANTTSVAAYAFEERSLPGGLVGEFGLRIEGTRLRGTPFGATSERSRTFVPVSGSLGLVYDPTEDVAVGLVLSASQRAPAESELFARGPHEATATFEIGDPNLDSETSYTAEIRATFARTRFRLEATAFYTYYDDYIFAQLTGRTVDEEGDTVPPTDDEALRELFYRARNAFFAGGEVSGRADLLYALGGTFGVDAQFDYVRARFTSGADRNLPRIPPIRWGGNLFYQGDWLRGRVGFLRTEEQNDVSSVENPTDAFTFLNASLTFMLAPLLPRVPIELSVQGTNLLDVEARNVVSINADRVLLPGRNVRGSVRVRF